MEKLLRRKKACDRALVFVAFLVLGLYRIFGAGIGAARQVGRRGGNHRLRH